MVNFKNIIYMTQNSYKILNYIYYECSRLQNKCYIQDMFLNWILFVIKSKFRLSVFQEIISINSILNYPEYDLYIYKTKRKCIKQLSLTKNFLITFINKNFLTSQFKQLFSNSPIIYVIFLPFLHTFLNDRQKKKKIKRKKK